jgi:hypothetical protein
MTSKLDHRGHIVHDASGIVQGVRSNGVDTYMPVVLAQSGVASSVTGTTAETTLASITIPGGMMGPNGMLRIRTFWSYTNSANNKNLRVNFGGTVLLNSNQTTTATAWEDTIISNRGALNSQGGVSRITSNSGNTSIVGVIAVAADTSTDKVVAFSAILASAAETITLEAYTVEVLPGA